MDKIDLLHVFILKQTMNISIIIMWLQRIEDYYFRGKEMISKYALVCARSGGNGN